MHITSTFMFIGKYFSEVLSKCAEKFLILVAVGIHHLLTMNRTPPPPSDYHFTHTTNIKGIRDRLFLSKAARFTDYETAFPWTCHSKSNLKVWEVSH